MKKISVLTLVGGISHESLSRKLYESLSPTDHDLDFTCAKIEKLPYFNQDLEMDPPFVVVEFKEHIKESDAVLFVTPEYNRSIPGVLKNAIDWGSQPMGKNCWENKPAAIMGVSRSKLGTFSAQVHLRIILNFLHMKVMAQPEYCLTAESHVLRGMDYFQEKKVKEKSENFLISFKEWIEFLSEKETNFDQVRSSLFSYSQEA